MKSKKVGDANEIQEKYGAGGGNRTIHAYSFYVTYCKHTNARTAKPAVCPPPMYKIMYKKSRRVCPPRVHLHISDRSGGSAWDSSTGCISHMTLVHWHPGSVFLNLHCSTDLRRAGNAARN